MRQEDYSPKQTATMKARVRRMRTQYRRRLTAAIIIFFVLGAVAGVFAHRWYVSRTPDVAATLQVNTPEPTAAEVTLAPQVTPEAWAMNNDQLSDDEDDIFPEAGDDQADTGAELDAFPEVDSRQLTEDADAPDEGQDSDEGGRLIAPGDRLEPQANEAGEDAVAQQPENGAEDVEPEATPQASDDQIAQDTGEADTVVAETSEAAETTETSEAAAATEAAEQGGEAQAPESRDLGYGPQVVAIVP